MSGFILQFLKANLYISAFIFFLLGLHLVRGRFLSNRTRYNLWYLLFILLSVPFVPFRVYDVISHIPWNMVPNGNSLLRSSFHKVAWPVSNLLDAAKPVNDFTISVSKKCPSSLERIMFLLWLTGMIAVLILLFLSLKKIKWSTSTAPPVQDLRIRKLYQQCLQELMITREIQIFSTTFLKSPMIMGLFRPRIYIPSHLISDFKETDIRYMLLHELMHYRYKDAVGNLLMNTALVLYWFNPFIWIAARVMRADREMACDEAVLYGLDQQEYKAYGNVLIDHIENVSLHSAPFGISLSAGFKNLRKRIRNIAHYRKPTLPDKIRNICFFLLTVLGIAITSSYLSPSLTLNAYDKEHYDWKNYDWEHSKWAHDTESISPLSYPDLFHKYEGSFVLFDESDGQWRICNPELAAERRSPDSTYKIYDALFALDCGLITANNSKRNWNGKDYPFDAWEADQNLDSAMRDSVNWYFQEFDEEIGIRKLKHYIHDIGYGNRNLFGDTSDYWLESSLKISPVEQVELLKRFHEKELPFSDENLFAVKDALRIESRGNTVLYGKTGSGRVDGKDINGWFVGFVEKDSHTYYFAVNIHADKDANGKKAYAIALNILSDMGIWQQ